MRPELLLLAAVVTVGGGWLVADRLHRRPALSWLTLHWPRALDAGACLAVLRQLATDRRAGVVVIETSATVGEVSYRLGINPAAVGDAEHLLHSLVADIELTPAVERPRVDGAWRVVVNTKHRPLRHDDPLTVTRALLTGLAAARRNETVVIQWALGPRRRPSPVARNTGAGATEPAWRGALFGSSRSLDSEQRGALGSKRSEHGFACVARVGVQARSAARVRALAVGVLAGLRAAESPGVRLSISREQPSRLIDAAVPLLRWPLVMNVAELVGLTGWPVGDDPLPGVPREGARWLRGDARLAGHGRVIAQATAPGDNRQLGLSISDALQHLHVIGPTGVGKSTVLLNLIVADIAAGRGVVVVDPKGQLVEDVLARVPQGRTGDVVVLDPADAERPVGLNPLAGAADNPELVADHVLAVFHGLYEKSWGPRTQDILHAALLSLAGRGETSLCALPVLLTNPQVRRRLLAGLDDPIALSPFWAWFDGISDGERHQAIAPVMNKLRPFLLRRRVRGVLGQTAPRFRIEEVFSKQKIVLVSLAKGLLGSEASGLLGSLFVAELWHATLRRAAVPAALRRPVTVFIDEFQDYLHLPTDLADALAQARGYSVGLTLSHQHLGQLSSGSMRSAVLANARSRVCFQLALEDAQVIARTSGGELRADDFQQLGLHEVYVRLVVGGEVTGFASGRTLPPPSVSSDPAVVREASRLRYGRPIAEVEAEIAHLAEGDEPSDGPVGTRRRRQP
jgi:hypothetical protein